jgi:hypothetical protein
MHLLVSFLHLKKMNGPKCKNVRYQFSFYYTELERRNINIWHLLLLLLTPDFDVEVSCTYFKHTHYVTYAGDVKDSHCRQICNSALKNNISCYSMPMVQMHIKSHTGSPACLSVTTTKPKVNTKSLQDRNIIILLSKERPYRQAIRLHNFRKSVYMLNLFQINPHDTITENEITTTTTVIYNQIMGTITTLLVLYILITLIVVVNIINVSKGPLRHIN